MIETQDRMRGPRPRLRFPNFVSADLWSIKPLSELCDMQAGKFITAAEILDKKEDGLFPCYGGNGLRGYTKTYTHNGRYPLIGRQGALCGNVNMGEGLFYATEHAVVVTPKSAVNVDWLFYALVSLDLNRFSTGLAQPGLSVEVLEKLNCAIPADEKEQEMIACFLSSIDEQITAQSRRIDALAAYRSGLMQHLFPARSDVEER